MTYYAKVLLGIGLQIFETEFQNPKIALNSDTDFTKLNTKHPLFITLNASLIGLGAVLFELTEENKRKVFSYNSRIRNTQEQTFSTLCREMLGIVHALELREFLIIGSPHPIHIFTNHRPCLQCFTAA